MNGLRSPFAGRRAIGHVLLMLAVGAWLVLLRPTALGGPAGYVVVAGTSMEPSLYGGALVLTLPFASYATGDVIAFRLPEQLPTAPLVIHRIVGGSAGDGFRTQGDNMPHPDPWSVVPEHIVGRQVAALPEGGRLVSLLRAPIVVASLAAGLSTYVLLGWLWPAGQVAPGSPARLNPRRPSGRPSEQLEGPKWS